MLSPPLHHVPKCHVYMSFKYLQGLALPNVWSPVTKYSLYVGFQRCVYQACNYEETFPYICSALGSYARACSSMGLILENWRSSMDNCSEYLLVVCHQMNNEEIVIRRKSCNWVTNIQLLNSLLVSVSTGLLFQDHVKKIVHML